ncbi:MAG: Copper-exporting P-type ATPase A [Candidatus Heimdallarchaeota archaeon LC_3]|nr:MAG: Copper-exporting P-type ATPase A [Candidatus Heimdallarchaeota archaeon LC_3]
MIYDSEVNKENLLLKISGMQCSFCVESIQKAFHRLDGVSHIGVSLSHEETLIQYNPEKITPSKLRETIESIGYKIRDPDKLKSFEDDRKELREQQRQLFFAAFISVFALVLMGLSWFNFKQDWIPIAMVFFTLVMIFIVGRSILQMAYASFRRGIYNQHVLMEFGAFGGLFGGLIGFFVQPWPMADFMGAAIFITTYHILSGYVSLVVRTSSSQAIQKLMNLQPDTARVLKNGNEIEIPVEEVQLGDLVRVKPGESIPVDGLILEGQSTVDQSLVTGESMPVIKAENNEVIGGSINQYGSLIIQTTKIGQDSFLQQISRSIQEARALKPGILQVVEKALKIFIPGVLFSALLAFLIWTVGAWIILGEIQFQTAIFATLAVLVMGYPCALGMATPLAMIRGGGIAAQQGILMRSGEAFQVFKDVRIIALDKTGTITEGRPKVVTISPVDGYDDKTLISLAAAIENNSEHPLANAIVEDAQNKFYSFNNQKITDFEATPGLGVKGTLSDTIVLVGSPRYLEQEGITFHEKKEFINRLEEEGQTVVGVTKNSDLIGFIGIADTIRPGVIDGIKRIKNVGFELVIITGDNERTAKVIAKQVGIERVISEVLPDEKADRIRKFQQNGNRVAMVGDGINDAPALMQADVGIAIGTGTDIAIESADIILVNNEISKVVDAYEIGKTSYIKTKQNVVLAFSFNGIGIPLAITGLLHPVFAMIAMAASVTAVLVNSFVGEIFSKPNHMDNQIELKKIEMTSMTLSISTIDNQTSIGILEKALLQVSGIEQAEGDLFSKIIVINYHKEEVTIGQILETVQKNGHEITEMIF